MIQLTRLNGNPLMINSDLVKTVEASPDTMLTLITGEKLIVSEECQEVMKRILAYRTGLLAQVAQKLGSGVDLARVASVASLRLDANGNVTPIESNSRQASAAMDKTRD
jgi:flagellar protein FlbD